MEPTDSTFRNNLSRRRFLNSLLALSSVSVAAACGTAGGPVDAEPSEAAGSAHDTPAFATGTDERLEEIENRYAVRLGVCAQSPATGHVYTYRADERFAMCSTFKVYAAAAILRLEAEGSLRLDETFPIDPDAIVVNSPVTSEYQGRMLPLDRLCEAALTRSDNTAGNLMLERLGGPEAVTAFARSVGDDETRLDRWEPELNSAERGDERDTTTAAGLSAGFREVLLGSGLPAPQQRTLLGWMRATTTSDTRIRAGLPPGWTSADKTAGGMYGTVNDAGVVWSPDGQPLVMAILSESTTGDPDAPLDGAPVAAATAALLRAA